MRYPEQDRSSFYKYTSAPTAVKILESSKVVYRSPLQFNDPFDVQSGLHFDFDVEVLPDIILDHIDELVVSDNRPDVSVNEPFGELVIRMWEMRKTIPFPREKFREVARPLLVLLKEQTVLFQQQYQDAWWSNFLPRLRVFCVSETHDNPLMWSHYSQDHTGVVFELRVLPEEDNPLCVARPVEYCSAPPSFFTRREWLDDVFGVRELDLSALYCRYAYVKSDVWAYEREWRLWDLLPSPEDGLHSYYELRANEIAAVYLGCRIAPEMKAAILRLLAGRSGVKVFQANKIVGDFRLEFVAA